MPPNQTQAPANTGKFEYVAFISYKRRDPKMPGAVDDEKIANWLWKKLERYHIPTGINNIRKKTLIGKVFLDKAELTSGNHVGKALEASLGKSQYLIVICSPRSAVSGYVNEEVELFIKQGKADKIIPLIIEGKPDACFPPALSRDTLGADINEMPPLTGSASLAVRKEIAFIKIVARLLNLDSFDQLYQRHLREQRRRRMLVSIAALATAAIVTLLAAYALYARHEAETRRAEAESLVSFLTFDLRDEIFKYIPLKSKELITDRVEDYYKKWSADTDKTLYIKAVHLGNRAQAATADGNLDAALKLYDDANAIITQLLEKNPGNPVLQNDRCTVLTSQAGIAMLRNNARQAQKLIEGAYGTALELVKNSPQNAVYKSTLGACLRSLQSLAQKRGDYISCEKYFVETLSLYRSLHAENPASLEATYDLQRTVSLAATFYDGVGQEARAAPLMQESLALARACVEKDALNHEFQVELSQSLLSAAFHSMKALEFNDSMQLLNEGVQISKRLSQKDSRNLFWQVSLAANLYLSGFISKTFLSNGPAGAKQMSEGRAIFDAHKDKLDSIGSLGDLAGKIFIYLENDTTLIGTLREQCEKNPGDFRKREELADALKSAAFQAKTDGRFVEAVSEYAEARRHYEALLAGDYAAEKTLLYLYECTAGMAETYEICGRYDEAIKCYQDAEKIVGAALKKYPENTGMKNYQVFVTQSACQIYEKQGRIKEALEGYQGLLKQQPGTGNPGLEGDMAMLNLHFRLFSAYQLLGDYNNALDCLKDTHRLAAAFHDKYPSMVFDLSALMRAEAEGNLGYTLVLLGREGEGVELLNQAAARAEKSMLKDKSVFIKKMYLARLGQIMEYHLCEDNFKEAAVQVEKMAPLLDFLVAQSRVTTLVEPDYCLAGYALVCDARIKCGDLAGAQKIFEESSKYAEALQQQHSSLSSLCRLYMAGLSLSGAEINVRNRQREKAREDVRRGDALLAELLKACPENALALEYAAKSQRILGDLEADSSDREKAPGHYKESAAIMKRLLEKEPRQRIWQKELRELDRKVAALSGAKK